MKIVIARQELAAALLFASNDESRFVLNGVQIEVRRNKTPVVVACDGRRLVAIETNAQQEDEFEDNHNFILRPDFVKLFVALSKACGGKLFPWICLENNPGSKRVKVSLIGGNVLLDVEAGSLIEGDYPAWRKVLPGKLKEREPISEIGLNAESVGDFAKAAKIMEAESPIVQMNLVGKEAQVEVKIKGLPTFYGLIMQCKLDESIEYQPEFVQIVNDLPKDEEQSEESKPAAA